MSCAAGAALEDALRDHAVPAGLALQFVPEVWVCDGDHRPGPIGDGFALEVHDPVLGDDVHHVRARGRDHVAGGQVEHHAARAYAVALVGGGHADERLAALGRVGAADELRLAAGAADVAAGRGPAPGFSAEAPPR